MQELEFNKGDIILKEGDVGYTMFQVMEGSVSIYLNYGSEQQKLLTDLGPGRIFGEMALLEVWPRSASAAASSDHTKLLEIGRDDLNDWLNNNPEQIRVIMENLSRRLRELTGDYHEVCYSIREMTETQDNVQGRSEGLLQRISKHGAIARLFQGRETVLEQAERESIRSQSGDRNVEEKRDLTCKKNQIIFRQGEKADSMFMVKWGRVGIYTGYDTPEEDLLVTLSEDQFFGEMGLLEKEPRSATAVALDKDTIITRITEDGLEQLLEERPAMVIMMLQHLSSRLRALTKDYVKACRTLSDLHDAEQNQRDLTEEELARISYYTALAQAMIPFY